MKKLNLYITFLLFSTAAFNTQAQLYTGVSAGYGFGICRTSNENSTTTYSTTTNKEEHESNPISLGKGLNTTLYAGYGLNKTLGVELGVGYLLGLQQSSFDKSSFDYYYSDKDEYAYTSRMLRCTPALRVSFGEKKSRLYIKSGLCIGVANKFTYINTHTATFFGDSDKSVEKREYTGGISLGFHSGIGFYYSVFKHCGFFAEANAYLQNWAPKRSEITEYTFNGVNELSNLSKSEREEEYLKEYTEGESSANSPAKAPKIYLPFSAVSLTLGFQIHFGDNGSKPILDADK